MCRPAHCEGADGLGMHPWACEEFLPVGIVHPSEQPVCSDPSQGNGSIMFYITVTKLICLFVCLFGFARN